MTKALIASACGLLLVVSGCGGNDTAAKRKAACVKTTKAMADYRNAGRAVGLNFFNRAGDEHVITAATVLRERLKQLAPFANTEQGRRFEEFTRALTQQEKILAALAVHNVPKAHKYADVLDENALERGPKAVAKLCAKSSS